MKSRVSAIFRSAILATSMGLLALLPLSLAAQTASPTAATASPPNPAGKVELVEGEVRVYDSARTPRAVKVGDMLLEGDIIETGKTGELHMNMEDGGFIAVRPNTKMSIVNYRALGDNKDKGIFSLLQGSFRSVTGWIGRFSQRNYTVRTPSATIGVRGTDHEPLVIPEGSPDGQPGTYDKVNIGSSYIKTAKGTVNVPTGKSAFASFAPVGKKQAPPQLLKQVPSVFRVTKHEKIIETRHAVVQKKIETLRQERHQNVIKHPELFNKKPIEGKLPHTKDALKHEPQNARSKHEERAKLREQRRLEKEKPHANAAGHTPLDAKKKQEERAKLKEQRVLGKSQSAGQARERNDFRKQMQEEKNKRKTEARHQRKEPKLDRKAVDVPSKAKKPKDDSDKKTKGKMPKDEKLPNTHKLLH